MVYEHRATVTVAGGSNNTTTLNVVGGSLDQVLVRALTDTTAVFRANLQDDKSKTRINWGYHTTEINDLNIGFPIVGEYTPNITNATPDDETFDVIMAVRERA
jgi:hypothetical protein